MASPSVTSVTQRRIDNASTAIQQRVIAGGFFDGSLPQIGSVRADSPLATGNSLYKYAPSNRGGLFFWDTGEAVLCTQLYVALGGSGDVRVYLCNLTVTSVKDDLPVTLAGEDILIEEATGVTYLSLNQERFKATILPYQAIKVVTTATGAAQIAQVTAVLERTSGH